MAALHRWKWNMNTTGSSSSRSSPRLAVIPSPWPGARRDCISPRPRRSSSSTLRTAGGILPRYYSRVRRPLCPSAFRSPFSPLLAEKDQGPWKDRGYVCDVSSLSLGGGGSGGRGGGGEGSDEAEGGRDREDDASNKEDDASNMLSSLQENPTTRFLDKLSGPSFSDSSSSTSTEVTNPVGNESNHSSDNDFYETASARNSINANSSEMGHLLNVHNQETTIDMQEQNEHPSVVNNPVGDESSYSSDNDTDETTFARNNNRNAYLLEMGRVYINRSEITIIVHGQNDATNQHPWPNTTPTNSPDVNKKKGFLGFLYTLVWALFTLYSALVTFSVTYPSSAKALVSFDDAWTKGICVMNLMSCFSSVVMLPFASRFKDGESTDDHAGFGIFIWALYLLLLALIPEYFLTVHVYLHIPNWVVWSLGTASFSLIVLPAVRYIEGHRPMVATMCAKYWKKLKCCCSTFLAPSRRHV